MAPVIYTPVVGAMCASTITNCTDGHEAGRLGKKKIKFCAFMG